MKLDKSHGILTASEDSKFFFMKKFLRAARLRLPFSCNYPRQERRRFSLLYGESRVEREAAFAPLGRVGTLVVW